ncbi:secondary thiamine-phosphate synthase enzyme YjbQ [Candidatus Woesearchaeota archaeon]|nr:secondary thiamine-phosphate synthase enzyme YjbQ [Candidatus Woesearchaeota archaeon]
MDIIKIKTVKKEELIDITEKISKLVNLDEGICFVYIRHATAAIFINENEDGFKEDFLYFLSKLIPENNWKHNLIDDNATSHLKANLLSHSIFIPIKDKKLMLGTWQKIFLAEFDGPRERELVLSFI